MNPQTIVAKRSIMDSTHMSFWKRFLKESNKSKSKTEPKTKNRKGIIRRWLSKGKHQDKGNMTTMEPAPDAEEKLPEEALERVLAYLPLPALFRARCICRRWRRIIAAPRFLHVRTEIPLMPAQPYFPLVMSQGYGRQCCAFDFAQFKWQSLAPLDFVPYKVACVGGAQGLLCLRNCFELLVVCNPITGQLRNLPRSTSSLVIGQCVVHMILDHFTQMYKIVIISGTGRTEVYDSELKKWTLTSESLPQGVPCIRGRTAAFCNGFLYCIVDEGVVSKLSGVIAYDVHLALWSSMLLALPVGFGEARSSNSLQPGSLSAALMACRGEVFLVAEKLQMGVTVIYIFELQLMTGSWSEVTYVPFEAPTPFESFKQGLRCDGVVVCEQMICLTSQAGEMAVFDMVIGSWHRLPDCPVSVSKTAESHIAMFPITPSLDALV